MKTKSRTMRAFALLLLFFSISSVNLKAEGKKYALIIGNSLYNKEGSFRPLNSPVEDVRLMNVVFRRLGFERLVTLDANKELMMYTIELFCRDLSADDVVVFYYSGHGMNSCDDYVFVPVDYIGKEYGSDDDAFVKLSNVRQMIGEKCRLSFFFIDACRNGESEERTKGSRLEPDFYPVKAEKTSGQYVCYATKDKNTVPDGEKGQNSSFAKILSKRLFDKGEFLDVWTSIEADVQKETRRTQMPKIEKHNIVGKFYFNKDGQYLPLDKQSVTFRLEPKDAKIILKAKTYGTKEEVYCSGQSAIFKDGDEFDYVVKCSGYITEEGQLKITNTRNECSRDFSRSLKKQEPAVLHVFSENTKKAKVYFDGRFVGNTPCKVKTMTGFHDVRVKSRLRYDYSKRILLDDTDMCLPVTLAYRTPSYFDWDEYAAHHVSYHFSPKYQVSLSYMYRIDGYNVTRLSYGLILGFSPWFFKGMGDYFSQSVSVDVSSSTSVSTSVTVGGVPIVGESEAKKIYDTSSMEYSSFVDPYGIAKYYDSNALALANIGFNACNGIMLEVGIGAAWHQDKYYMENTYKVIETIKGEESPIYDYSPQNVSHLYKGKVKCSPAIRLGVNFMIPFNRDYDFGLTIGGGYIYLPMNHRSSSWDASLGFIWSY